MHQISLNIFQVIILLVFVCIFAYYWTPKPKTNHTEEYLALLDEHNKLKSQYKKLIKSKQPPSGNITIGKPVSAHSSMVRPTTGLDKDNKIVQELVK